MTLRFRLLGFLPLVFFLAHLRYHLIHGTPENVLWMCNISNVTLAAGIFFNSALLIRISAIWFIPALPLWLTDMLNTTEDPPSTFFSHIGGLTVSMIALMKVGVDRVSWIYAVIYGLLLQQFCRYFTPPKLNVNVAFAPYLGWEHVFDAYWKYWVFTAVLAVAALFLMNELLRRIFPARTLAAG